MARHVERVPLRFLGLSAFFLLLPSCQATSGDQACRQLSKIAQAVANYRDVNGSFPPAIVFDDRGRPLHSWRVLLLPFVEANGFTEQYDFTAAWDGAANGDLANGSRTRPANKFRVPAAVRSVYQDGQGEPDPSDFTTTLVMLVPAIRIAPLGRGQPGSPPALSGQTGLDSEGENGSLTILKLRTSDVHWMRPCDVSFGDGKEYMISFSNVTDQIVASVEVFSDGSSICYGRDATIARLRKRRAQTTGAE